MIVLVVSRARVKQLPRLVPPRPQQLSHLPDPVSVQSSTDYRTRFTELTGRSGSSPPNSTSMGAASMTSSAKDMDPCVGSWSRPYFSADSRAALRRGSEMGTEPGPGHGDHEATSTPPTQCCHSPSLDPRPPPTSPADLGGKRPVRLQLPLRHHRRHFPARDTMPLPLTSHPRHHSLLAPTSHSRFKA